jgi:MoxR-vWA-beta-propeller ternary system domain bpX5
MKDDLLPVSWRPRPVPLDPVGVAARGEAARAMAKRLLARWDRDEEALSRLSGVAGPDLIILLGDAQALPWVEGAAYLGRDAHAPSLLLPTNREPAVPLPLLERALLIRASRLHTEPPLAVLLDPPLLASTLEARPLIRSQIQAWLENPAEDVG